MKFLDIIHNSIIDDKYDYDESLKKLFKNSCVKKSYRASK